MSPGAVEQRESELIDEFADAPPGIGGSTRLALHKKPAEFNAAKHGLSAYHLILSADEFADYAQMGLEFMLDIRPVGVREIGNAQFLFESRWRVQRILAVENDLFVYQQPFKEDAGPKYKGRSIVRQTTFDRHVNAFREEARHLELISRYETRIIRNAARVDDELAKQQKRRGKKVPFDEQSNPAIVWYRRLVIRAANYMAAKKEYEDSMATGACSHLAETSGEPTSQDC